MIHEVEVYSNPQILFINEVIHKVKKTENSFGYNRIIRK